VILQLAMWIALGFAIVVGLGRAFTAGREAKNNVTPREGRVMNFLALCIVVAAAIIWGRTKV